MKCRRASEKRRRGAKAAVVPASVPPAGTKVHVAFNGRAYVAKVLEVSSRGSGHVEIRYPCDGSVETINFSDWEERLWKEKGAEQTGGAVAVRGAETTAAHSLASLSPKKGVDMWGTLPTDTKMHFEEKGRAHRAIVDGSGAAASKSTCDRKSAKLMQRRGLGNCLTDIKDEGMMLPALGGKYFASVAANALASPASSSGTFPPVGARVRVLFNDRKYTATVTSVSSLSVEIKYTDKSVEVVDIVDWKHRFVEVIGKKRPRPPAPSSSSSKVPSIPPTGTRVSVLFNGRRFEAKVSLVSNAGSWVKVEYKDNSYEKIPFRDWSKRASIIRGGASPAKKAKRGLSASLPVTLAKRLASLV